MMAKATDTEILHRAEAGSSYVDWGAILAGAALAATTPGHSSHLALLLA